MTTNTPANIVPQDGTVNNAQVENVQQPQAPAEATEVEVQGQNVDNYRRAAYNLMQQSYGLPQEVTYDRFVEVITNNPEEAKRVYDLSNKTYNLNDEARFYKELGLSHQTSIPQTTSEATDSGVSDKTPGQLLATTIEATTSGNGNNEIGTATPQSIVAAEDKVLAQQGGALDALQTPEPIQEAEQPTAVVEAESEPTQELTELVTSEETPIETEQALDTSGLNQSHVEQFGVRVYSYGSDIDEMPEVTNEVMEGIKQKVNNILDKNPFVDKNSGSPTDLSVVLYDTFEDYGFDAQTADALSVTYNDRLTNAYIGAVIQDKDLGGVKDLFKNNNWNAEERKRTLNEIAIANPEAFNELDEAALQQARKIVLTDISNMRMVAEMLTANKEGLGDLLFGVNDEAATKTLIGNAINSEGFIRYVDFWRGQYEAGHITESKFAGRVLSSAILLSHPTIPQSIREFIHFKGSDDTGLTKEFFNALSIGMMYEEMFGGKYSLGTKVNYSEQVKNFVDGQLNIIFGDNNYTIEEQNDMVGRVLSRIDEYILVETKLPKDILEDFREIYPDASIHDIMFGAQLYKNQKTNEYSPAMQTLQGLVAAELMAEDYQGLSAQLRNRLYGTTYLSGRTYGVPNAGVRAAEMAEADRQIEVAKQLLEDADNIITLYQSRNNGSIDNFLTSTWRNYDFTKMIDILDRNGRIVSDVLKKYHDRASSDKYASIEDVYWSMTYSEQMLLDAIAMNTAVEQSMSTYLSGYQPISQKLGQIAAELPGFALEMALEVLIFKGAGKLIGSAVRFSQPLRKAYKTSRLLRRNSKLYNELSWLPNHAMYALGKTALTGDGYHLSELQLQDGANGGSITDYNITVEAKNYLEEANALFWELTSERIGAFIPGVSKTLKGVIPATLTKKFTPIAKKYFGWFNVGNSTLSKALSELQVIDNSFGEGIEEVISGLGDMSYHWIDNIVNGTPIKAEDNPFDFSSGGGGDILADNFTLGMMMGVGMQAHVGVLTVAEALIENRQLRSRTREIRENALRIGYAPLREAIFAIDDCIKRGDANLIRYATRSGEEAARLRTELESGLAEGVTLEQVISALATKKGINEIAQMFKPEVRDGLNTRLAHYVMQSNLQSYAMASSMLLSHKIACRGLLDKEAVRVVDKDGYVTIADVNGQEVFVVGELEIGEDGSITPRGQVICQRHDGTAFTLTANDQIANGRKIKGKEYFKDIRQQMSIDGSFLSAEDRAILTQDTEQFSDRDIEAMDLLEVSDGFSSTAQYVYVVDAETGERKVGIVAAKAGEDLADGHVRLSLIDGIADDGGLQVSQRDVLAGEVYILPTSVGSRVYIPMQYPTGEIKAVEATITEVLPDGMVKIDVLPDRVFGVNSLYNTEAEVNMRYAQSQPQVEGDTEQLAVTPTEAEAQGETSAESESAEDEITDDETAPDLEESAATTGPAVHEELPTPLDLSQVQVGDEIYYGFDDTVGAFVVTAVGEDGSVSIMPKAGGEEQVIQEEDWNDFYGSLSDARDVAVATIGGTEARGAQVANAEEQSTPATAQPTVVPTPQEVVAPTTTASGIPLAESGEPIFEVAPVDATIDYLANELGFSAEEIEGFVGLRAEEARVKLEELSNNPPKMMSNPIEYRQAKADWQLAVSVAEGAMNYWGDVMSAIQAGKGEQAVAEESTTAEISEAEVVQERPTTETPIETIAESEPTSEPQPIGRGVFGNIYDQFRGKAKEAIAFLLGKKDGEAIGALHHKEIGDIDLVWGAEGTGHSDGFGLAKLVKYHPEVLDNLQEILDDMHVTSRTANRIQLESETHRASVRLTWDNQSKTWLLTAFEKRETSEPTSSSSDVASTQNESLDDTATQQSPDVSDGEVSENVSDVQEGNGGSVLIAKLERLLDEDRLLMEDWLKAETETEKEKRNKIWRNKSKEITAFLKGLSDEELSLLRQHFRRGKVRELDEEIVLRDRQRTQLAEYDEIKSAQPDIVRKSKKNNGKFEDALGDDILRPVLMGVYHDAEGYAVATNGIVLIADKQEYNSRKKGKIVGKDGKEINGNYPQWRRVIPAETIPIAIDLQDLSGFIGGLKKMYPKKSERKNFVVLIKNSNGVVCYYNMAQLETFVDGAIRLGATASEIRIDEKGFLLADTKNGIALLASKPGLNTIDTGFVYEPQSESITANGREVVETEAPATTEETQAENAGINVNTPISADVINGIEDIETLNGLLAEIDKQLRDVSESEAIREQARAINEQYGSLENAPADIQERITARWQANQANTRILYDNKYAIQDRIRAIEEAQAEAERQDAIAQEMARQATVYNGFLVGMSPMARGRAEKTLSKKKSYNGKVMTRAEFIEQGVADGREFSVGEWKGKTEYRVSADVGFYTITKLEYDYAQYLKQLAQNNATATSEVAPIETTASEQVAEVETTQAEPQPQSKLGGLRAKALERGADAKRLDRYDQMPLTTLRKQARNYEAALRRITDDAVRAEYDYVRALIAEQERNKKNNKWGVKVGNTATPFEVVRAMFEEWNSDEDVAALFEKVAPIFEKLPVTILFSDTIGGKSTQGSYKAAKGELKLPGHFVYSDTMSNQKKAQTILHEMIHAVTSYALYVDEMPALQSVVGMSLTPEMRKAVDTLRLIFGKIKNDADFKGYYGATDVHEMVAELSNPEFRAKLREKGLWQQIVDAIKRLLGIEVNNALDGAEGALQKMLDNFDRTQWDKMVAVGRGDASMADRFVKYSIRTKPAPTLRGIGYKVFVLKDGKLYPPMVANPDGAETPVGVWLDADAAPVVGTSKTGRPKVKAGGKGTQGGSGQLAYRPGWHLGTIPYALQFNRKNPQTGERELFPANFVWAEVEYADDIDYQEEAMSYGYNEAGNYQHSLAGLPRLPEDGSYMYRTNPDPHTDPWVITGAMRVKRLLPPSEVDALVKSAGRDAQPRQEGAITDEQIRALNEELGLERVDNQGNPIDENGRLILEEVQSISSLTDEDFTVPSRNVQLPPIPQNIDSAIGANGKPVVIKKNVFVKNAKTHDDLTANDGRAILSEALYNPNLYGQNRKATRPYNWILIHSADTNSAIIVEVNETKDNVEIVNWHYLSDESLERKKRQAIREGGLILTLESAVANTPNDLSSTGKDSEEVGNVQTTEGLSDELARPGDVFYSNAERAVLNIKQDKATPQQWLAMIEKQGGLKAGEDKWLGLSDWLKASDAKTLTKGEVLDYINQNKIVIEEVNYGVSLHEDMEDYEQRLTEEANDSPKWNKLMDELNKLKNEEEVLVRKQAEEYEELTGDDYNWNEYEIYVRAYERMADKYGDEFRQAFKLWDEYFSLIPRVPSKFAEYLGLNVATPYERQINHVRMGYTTRGLNNKREIALVVPTVAPYNASDEIHFGDAGDGRAVAWVRFGEARVPKRVPDAGSSRGYTIVPERVLVIDEIQSKRHQDGREKGYQQGREELVQKIKDLTLQRDNIVREILHKQGFIHYDEPSSMGRFNPDALDSAEAGRLGSKAEMDEIKRLNEGIRLLNLEDNKLVRKVPDAPFDKNWHELAMKRMLRYAAENGYDKVAWTTGEQQAKRYGLGNNISKISVSKNFDNSAKIISFDYRNPDGYPDFYQSEVDANGKIISGDFSGNMLLDIVGKELATKLMATENGSIPGENLRLGGEGMKGFYDKMLPSFMNKYGKKWGVKVGEVSLLGETMHSVDVTDAMRESVMAGQAMFRPSEWMLDPTQEVEIVETEPHEFKDFGEAREWAKREIVGEYINGEIGAVNVSGKAIDKYLSGKAVGKSDSRDVHLSALQVLPKIIETSAVGEIHEDKNSNEQIKDIVRLFGAVKIGDRTYRVKTTVKRYVDDNVKTKAYSYEVTEIELLEGTHDDGKDPRPRTSNNSITLANLLKGVEKSNKPGEFLLDNAVVAGNNFAEVAERAGERLGVKVVVDPTMGSKGSYNLSTGEVRVNPDAHLTEADVERTVVHEVIGHGGMQALLGERFDGVCKMVFKQMSDEQVADIRRRHGKGLSDAEVGAEYMAETAERMASGEQTTSKLRQLWERIKGWIREAVRRRGIAVAMTDADIRYMIATASRKAKEGKLQEMIDHAVETRRLRRIAQSQDAVEGQLSQPLMRPKEGADSPLVKGIAGMTDAELVQRLELDGISKVIASRWNRENTTGSAAGFYTNMVDASHPIHKVLQKMYGLDKVDDVEKILGYGERNAYMMRERAASRAADRLLQFRTQVLAPLNDMRTDFARRLAKEFGLSSAEAIALSKVYFTAKTGLERQRVKEDVASEAEGMDYAGLAGTMVWMGSLLKDWQGVQLPKIDWEAEANARGYRDMLTKGLKRGHSAVEELMRDRQAIEEILAAKGYPSLQEFVEFIDSMVITPRSASQTFGTSDMWRLIQATSRGMLEGQAQAGLLSAESYQRLAFGDTLVNILESRGVKLKLSDKRALNEIKSTQQLVESGYMSEEEIAELKPYYEFYLPLKGTADVTLDKLTKRKGLGIMGVGGSSTIKSVSGHTHMVQDPIATLAADYANSVMNEEENMWKLSLLNAVREHMMSAGENAIAVASGTGYESMAFSKIENVASRGIKSKVQSVVEDKHAVPVYENGKLISMVFLDESVATSCNRTKELGDLEERIGRSTRFMANLFTTYSLNFIVRNMVRDTRSALEYATVYWGGKGVFTLSSLMTKEFKGELYREARNRLDGKRTSDTKAGRLVEEFFSAGSRTAVNQLGSQELFNQTLKELERELGMTSGKVSSKKMWRSWQRMYEVGSSMAEMRARLLVFATAKEMGLSTEEAVHHAKESTVNFDRRGRYSRYFGMMQMFMNASIQSLRRQGEMWRRHPFRKLGELLFSHAIWKAGILSLGYGIYLLATGDDEEEMTFTEYMKYYLSINSFTLASNDIIPIGLDGVTIALPNAVDSRPMNTIVNLIVKRSLFGHNDDESLEQDIFDVANALVDGLGIEVFSRAMDLINPSMNKFDFVNGALHIAGANPVVNIFSNIMYNMNFLGSPLYKERFGDDRYSPRPLYLDDYNTTWGTLLAMGLNYLSGGDETHAGAINWRGSTITELTQGFARPLGEWAEVFAAVWNTGRYFMGEKTMITISGEVKDMTIVDLIRSLPIVGAFTHNSLQRYYEIDRRNTYFNIAEQSKYWMGDLQSAYKAGNVRRATELIMEDKANAYFMAIGREWLMNRAGDNAEKDWVKALRGELEEGIYYSPEQTELEQSVLALGRAVVQRKLLGKENEDMTTYGYSMQSIIEEAAYKVKYDFQEDDINSLNMTLKIILFGFENWQDAPAQLPTATSKDAIEPPTPTPLLQIVDENGDVVEEISGEDVKEEEQALMDEIIDEQIFGEEYE